ncbi:MAG: ferredoxin [Kineosporiaceae bacterium]|nr:ferredoxin [Kineosporiaceae bacterium]
MASPDARSSRRPDRGGQDRGGQDRGRDTHRVRVNPIACEGIGMCAHLAPDVIVVDDWGYPMPATRDLDRREVRAVRSAIAACPRRALFLT